MIRQLFLISILMVNLPVFSGDMSNTLLSGAEVDYPPYSYVNSHDKADGFAIDLLQASMNAMDKKVSFKIDTWQNVKKALEKGDIEVLPLVGRTPEREEFFDFSIPYLTMHGTIVVRKGQPVPAELDELSQLRVGVMEGDNAEEYLRRQDIDYTIVTTSTFSEALQMLSESKLDAVVIQKLLATQLISELNRPGFSGDTII